MAKSFLNPENHVFLTLLTNLSHKPEKTPEKVVTDIFGSFFGSILSSKHMLRKVAEMSHCEICNYTTSKPANFERHMFSLKHSHRTKMSWKVAEMSVCFECDYSTSKKSNYDKHLLTPKHLLRTSQNHTIRPKPVYACDECGKTYQAKSGLWYHKKKCNQYDTQIAVDDADTDIKKELDDIKLMLKTLMNKKTTQDITVNNTIHQKMSINVYLNDYCGEAINLGEFVEKIQLSLHHLWLTKEQGYTKAISDILIQNLSQLDDNKRPFHCSDVKRQQFYVRYNNKWNRDNGEKITHAVDKVATKHILKLKEWEAEHPDWATDDKLNHEYMLMLQNILGGATDEEQEKNKKDVVKLVSEAVLIKDAMNSMDIEEID